jgi:hypothetical protein
VDQNNNGLSDIWELEQNNGVAFSANNPAHDATSDPDSDGWTNAQECLAGTNPFDGSIPFGKTTLRITPALEQASFEVSWPVIPGKNYRLQVSSDLQFWVNVGSWITAEVGESQRSIGLQTSDPDDPDAPAPTRLYWRIKVADRDEDGDGLSTADELVLGLNPLQQQTSPGFSDPIAVESYLQSHPGGIEGVMPSTDQDGDGLNYFKESSLGTDPLKKDTDEDGKNDGQDAVPLDKEIDWNKVEESKYSWNEQVAQVSTNPEEHRPIAINKDAQILFYDSRNVASANQIQEQKSLWDSNTQQWVTLPLSGSQAIIVGTREVVMEEPVIEFIDINDDGVIYGLGRGDDYREVDPIVPGMVWKRIGAGLTQYSTPKYFFPIYPFPAPTPPASWSTSFVENRYSRNEGVATSMFGGIANDGTINAICSGTGVGTDVWMNYDTAGDTFSMTKIKDLDENIEISKSFPAAVLDEEHSLCVERIETSNGAWQSKVWLKEGGNFIDLSFMTNQTVQSAELQETPNTKKDGSKRLWVAIEDACYIEKGVTSGGNDRWYKPASMGEGIIRLNEYGIAITSGKTNENTVVPPKLWRNGKYVNMNDLITKEAGSTLMIIKAIDISSNGIILVQATENGATKTGFLKPIP